MQAWDTVKVTAEGPNKGRAGLVVRNEKDINIVRLDASDTAPVEQANFTDDELQLLGR